MVAIGERKVVAIERKVTTKKINKEKNNEIVAERNVTSKQ
jgi:hypothetical protein